MYISLIDVDLDMMQLEIFFNVLDIIENRFSNWFISRKGVNKSQKHDMLANHINILSNEFGVVFTFKKGSELPDEIKDQCIRSYEILFSVDYKDELDT